MKEFMSPMQAYDHYGLRTERSSQKTELETSLEKAGIAAIEMPLTPDDFQRLSAGMAVCIEECPELLKQTFYKADPRYGGEVGYVRKEKRVDVRSGLQTDDPKHYFHFTEQSRSYWRERFATGPTILTDFLEDGYEIHDALIGVAKTTVAEMETTHPGISTLYFPENDSFSFLRLLRYDGYEPYDGMAEVAKPHFDIGGVTIQAYADAPGFWAAPDGVGTDRTYYDTQPQTAYTFLGKGHEKVYGPDDTLRPLWHGVDRVVPTGVSFVPERTAVILFLDSPEVDYHVKRSDTLPQLGRLAMT